MTDVDSHRRQNLKSEYLPEDSLQQQVYVPLPAGGVFKCKDCLKAECLSTKNCLQADSIFQITGI